MSAQKVLESWRSEKSGNYSRNPRIKEIQHLKESEMGPLVGTPAWMWDQAREWLLLLLFSC